LGYVAVVDRRHRILRRIVGRLHLARIFVAGLWVITRAGRAGATGDQQCGQNPTLRHVPSALSKWWAEANAVRKPARLHRTTGLRWCSEPPVATNRVLTERTRASRCPVDMRMLAVLVGLHGCASSAAPAIANRATEPLPAPRNPICTVHASLDTTGIRHIMRGAKDALSACYARYGTRLPAEPQR